MTFLTGRRVDILYRPLFAEKDNNSFRDSRGPSAVLHNFHKMEDAVDTTSESVLNGFNWIIVFVYTVQPNGQMLIYIPVSIACWS